MEWLNETLPYLNLPWEASEEELRACLMDGTVFCNLLNQLSPGSMKMVLDFWVNLLVFLYTYAYLDSLFWIIV